MAPPTPPLSPPEAPPPALAAPAETLNAPYVQNMVRNMNHDDLKNIFAEELPELHTPAPSANQQVLFVRAMPADATHRPGVSVVA